MTSRNWHARPGRSAPTLGAFALLLIFLSAAGATTVDRRVALPAPVDLNMDGTQAALRGKPIVILFSLPGCSFCEGVRQNYLAPLMRDMPEQQRPIIREVRIADTATFSGFNREPVSHRGLARSYGVRFAPTVVLVDRAGNLLAAPIVGGDVAGLYGGLLDNAFVEASRKLAGTQPGDMKRAAR